MIKNKKNMDKLKQLDNYFKNSINEIPLYGGNFMVILSNDKNKIKKINPNFCDNDIYAHTMSFDYKGVRTIGVLLNFNREEELGGITHITNGTIAHEVAHASNFLFDIIGAKPDFDNSEPIAYLASWFAEKVYELINKNNFKVK